MPQRRFRNKQTGEIVTVDDGMPAAPAPQPEDHSTADFVTKVAAPMAAGVVGGRLSGPLGSAALTTGATAFGDLYRALTQDDVPPDSGPRLNESPTHAMLRGGLEAGTEEAKHLAKTFGYTLAGEMAIPKILQWVPQPSKVLAAIGRKSPTLAGAAGLGGGYGIASHPMAALPAAAMEAAAPVGRALEKAVTPGTAGRTTAWGALKGELGDMGLPTPAQKYGELKDYLMGRGTATVAPTSLSEPPITIKTGSPMPKARMSTEVPYKAPGELPTQGVGKTPYGGAEPAPYRASARKVIADEAKAAREASAAAQIEEAKAGLEAQPPSIRETVSAPTATGRQSMSTQYAAPEAELGVPDDMAEVRRMYPNMPAGVTTKLPTPKPAGDLMDMFQATQPTGPKGAFDWPEAGGRFAPDATGSHVLQPTVATQQAAPAGEVTLPESFKPFAQPSTPAPAPQPVAGPETSALLKFFKTPEGATGYNYRLAKEAEQAGEIPTAQYAREARLRASQPPPAPSAPAEDWTTTGPWMQDEYDAIEALKKYGLPPTTP